MLYALFGILDLFIVPDVAQWIWLIRYVIFCPFALAVLALTFTPWFKRVMQPVLSAVVAVCGLGIVAMIAIADAEAGYLYYAGLLLVVPWGFTVLQIRFSYAVKVSILILAGYEAVAIWVKPTPAEILINNNFFFVSAVIIGMVAGYTMERSVRTDFLQRRLIEAQREELAHHNVQLDSALQESLEEVRHKAEELQASRARIVVAADDERRRIERNLHDGAQQHLVGLTIKMRLAAELADDDPEEAKALLGELRSELQEAVQELRNLAHGIYPPLLMDEGLEKALSAAVRRAPLPATVEASSVGRYSPEVEATTYFCCMEALQNACKHAGEDATVTISVREADGSVVFEVADDGAGFNPDSRGLGAGFVNMSDRLGTLGGSLRVESSPGRGTRVVGTVPVATGDGQPARPAEAGPSSHRRSVTLTSSAETTS